MYQLHYCNCVHYNYVICAILLQFFFGRVLKDKIYSRKPKSVNDMKNYVRDAFQEINTQTEVCKNICQSVRGRLQTV